MNINPRMQTIGSELNIPTYPDIMQPANNGGEYPEKYIVYYYSDERPISRGSNADIAEGVTVQVHLFTKDNPVSLKERLKAKLRESFVLQNLSQYYEQETGYHHIIVTVWDWDTI